MKRLTNILVTMITASLSNMSIASETMVLRYHSEQVKHEIHIADGKVVGGKSLGGFVWEVTGGAYDGRNLHVTFTSSQREGCKSWFTHIYEINQAGPRMLVNVDKCGKTITDLNKQYYW